jgi:site-specific DNA-methyltransferase (adenine-specific)
MTLYNADCLTILKTLESSSIDATICDPPYSITRAKWDKQLPWDEIFTDLLRINKPKSPIVLFASQPFTSYLVSNFLSYYRYQWVWVKNVSSNFLNAKKQPLRNTEDILVFSKEGNPTYNIQMREGFKPYVRDKTDKNAQSNIYGEQSKHLAQSLDGTRYPNTTLYFNKTVNERKLHPSQKPIELMKYLVNTYTNQGGVVLDFCMGSGSTLVACKQLNRNFMGIEKDKKFYDIAVDRLN